MRDVMKMVIVLFISCGLAAGSLAVVYAVTKNPIADHEKQQRETALREVSAGADDFKEVTPDKVWEAVTKGEKTGHVFQAEVQGYSGPVKMMFGIDTKGAITGFKVLVQTETPGLGAKIITPRFRDQFKDRTSEQIVLKKDDPIKGQIDAVTGATISSRAVTNAARMTLESFEKEKAGGEK